jgi:hypothetical protein
MTDDEARMTALAKTGGPPAQAELLRILGRLGPVDRLLIEAVVAERDAFRAALRKAIDLAWTGHGLPDDLRALEAVLSKE